MSHPPWYCRPMNSTTQLDLPIASVAPAPSASNTHLNFPLVTTLTDAQLAEIQRTMSARFPRRPRSTPFTRYHRLR